MSKPFMFHFTAKLYTFFYSRNFFRNFFLHFLWFHATISASRSCVNYISCGMTGSGAPGKCVRAGDCTGTALWRIPVSGAEGANSVFRCNLSGKRTELFLPCIFCMDRPFGLSIFCAQRNFVGVNEPCLKPSPTSTAPSTTLFGAGRH